MENFNEYDPIKFKSAFQNSELYNKIVENADIIVWEKYFSTNGGFRIFDTNTPREIYAKKVVFLAPFYYLQFLTELNPSKIYDIGCGMNYFKKFIPSVIGIDAEINNGKIIGDIYAQFDERFVLKNKFDSAFSINSLHFIPITQLRQRILDFVRVINTGGRGFLTLNSHRLIENSLRNEQKLVFPDGVTLEQLNRYVRTQFDNIEDIKILCLDIDPDFIDDWMNGNIRLVFEKR